MRTGSCCKVNEVCMSFYDEPESSPGSSQARRLGVELGEGPLPLMPFSPKGYINLSLQNQGSN